MSSATTAPTPRRSGTGPRRCCGTPWDGLDAGGVPALESQTEQTVKDCLALHWARSHSFKTAAELAKERSGLRAAAGSPGSPSFSPLAFRQQTGRDDPTQQELADLIDDITRGPDDVVDGRHFAAQVLHFFAQAQAVLADWTLVVSRCLPGARDLVIADKPSSRRRDASLA